MPRKVAEACMFCGSQPCECDGPPKPKKKVSKSSRSTTTNGAVLPSNSAPVPTSRTAPMIDTRAAMKAAMTERTQVAPRVGFEMKTKTETAEDTDAELATCLNTLYPLLHEDEIHKHSHLFDKPQSRAQRWREAHG